VLSSIRATRRAGGGERLAGKSAGGCGALPGYALRRRSRIGAAEIHVGDRNRKWPRVRGPPPGTSRGASPAGHAVGPHPRWPSCRCLIHAAEGVPQHHELEDRHEGGHENEHRARPETGARSRSMMAQMRIIAAREGMTIARRAPERQLVAQLPARVMDEKRRSSRGCSWTESDLTSMPASPRRPGRSAPIVLGPFEEARRKTVSCERDGGHTSGQRFQGFAPAGRHVREAHLHPCFFWPETESLQLERRIERHEGAR